MPGVWTNGRRLGFEVRACPVSRKERERDVFLSALDRAKAIGAASPIRENIYLEWLSRRMRAANGQGGNYVDAMGDGHEPIVELLPGGYPSWDTGG